MPSDTDASDGSTRRRFLGGTVLGGLAAGLLGRGSRTATAASTQSDDPADVLEFDCSSVRNLSEVEGGARIDFADGSYIAIRSAGLPDAAGSPGRVLERVSVNDAVVENPNADCDPGRRATTFTDGAVFVGAAELVEPSFDPQGATAVTLHFADGASQEVLAHSEGGGIADEGSRWGLSTTYRGRGEHAGKVIEAIEFDYTGYDTVVHLRNPDAGAQLLGKATASERVVEVVGATEGEVEYEFTATGPVQPASLTERVEGGGNDEISDNGDGTWTASGFTGNTGYGDAYVVNGEITDFAQTGGDAEYVVREAERRVTERSYDDPRLVRIVGSEAGEVSYEFTVDGIAYPVANVGDPLGAEDNDQVGESGGSVTVSGFTGNEGYGDTYVVAGDITDFQRTGGDAAFEIRVDGRVVSEDEFVDDY